MQSLKIIRLLLFFLPLNLLALGDNYFLEAKDAPVLDLARLIAKVENFNVVLPDDLKGKVTASFASTSLKNALDIILDSKGYGAYLKGNTYQVMTKAELATLGHGLKTETIVLRNSKVATVVPQVITLKSPRGIVTSDLRTNSITIKDTPENINGIKKFIQSIDQNNRQVLIEARIVEASTDFVRDLGIQWGTGYQKRGLVKIGGGLGDNSIVSTLSKDPQSAINLSLGPFKGVNLDLKLAAAEDNGKATVLSRPSIVTMNNQPAVIKSGISFNVKTSSGVNISAGAQPTQNSGSNLEQISAGIEMNVTPQITSDDKVNLAIIVSESKPDYANAVDGIPAIVDNMAQTSVLLKDGEVTVIGGLFQITDSEKTGGVPFLNKIPILGLLFGKQEINREKKELIVFIKPLIVREKLENLGTEEELIKMREKLTVK